MKLQAEAARLTKRIEEEEKKNEELEKENPTQRLDKSYSMKAVEKRRREAKEKKYGTPKKHGCSGDRQPSDRRKRLSNKYKIERADQHRVG